MLDKFDFACFVAFLIKLSPKVYPQISDTQVAVKNLIEDFILPLHSQLAAVKSS